MNYLLHRRFNWLDMLAGIFYGVITARNEPILAAAAFASIILFSLILEMRNGRKP